MKKYFSVTTSQQELGDNYTDITVNVVDLNECEMGPSSLCQETCVNVPGSFYCECSEGHILQEDGATCTGDIYHLAYLAIFIILALILNSL